MEKTLSDAFLNFYKVMLKPEFDAIKEKQVEHDERLSQVLGHFDSIYDRLGRLEEQTKELVNRIDSVEEQLGEQKRLPL